jgi:hypothetical protein
MNGEAKQDSWQGWFACADDTPPEEGSADRWKNKGGLDKEILHFDETNTIAGNCEVRIWNTLNTATILMLVMYIPHLP